MFSTLERLEANAQAEREYVFTEGVETGLAQGRADEKFEIAKNLLKLGLPLGDIATVTGLPLPQIQALQQKTQQ